MKKKILFLVIIVYVFLLGNLNCFAVSEEVIKAYKAEQNIIRGWIVFGMWPLVAIMVNYFDAMLRYHDMWHWRCMINRKQIW